MISFKKCLSIYFLCLEFFSRCYAWTIRLCLKFLKIDITHIEQLEGGLYSTKAGFRKLLSYSDATTIQSVNKRDRFSEGVYLNERFLISLQEVQVDTHTGICHFQRRIIHESSLWGAQYLLLTVIPRPILSKTLQFPKDVTPVLLPSIGYFHWLTEELGPFLFALRNTQNPIVFVFSVSMVVLFLSNGLIHEPKES